MTAPRGRVRAAEAAPPAAMDARKLRYFVTIAELGGFSEAARRLHVAQPALSRHVRDLEAELGVALLVREPRGVRLTPQGERLHRHAIDLLERLDALPSLVAAPDGPIEGRVVVGLPTSASAVLAGPLMRRAFERLPGVRVHLIESLSGYLQEWIEAGRVDVAVLYSTPSSPSVRVQPLLVEDMWLVGHADALVGSGGEVPLADLGRLRFVVPGRSHSHRRLVEGAAAVHGVTLDVIGEVDSLPALKALVEDGRTFTILPHSAIHGEIAAGRLAAARIVSPSISRTVSVATARARADGRACAALAALLVDTARTLVRDRIWAGRPVTPADARTAAHDGPAG